MNRTGLDQLLTTVFMLLAVGAIIVFFASSNRLLFYVLGGVAVVIRLVQYGMRFFGRRQKRKLIMIDEEFDNNIRK